MFNSRETANRILNAVGIAEMEELASSDGEMGEPSAKRQLRQTTVFSDGRALKLAQQLFFGYISQDDTGAFTSFLTDLDKMMMEYREDSNSPISLNEDEEDKDEEEDNTRDEDEDEDNPFKDMPKRKAKLLMRRMKKSKKGKVSKRTPRRRSSRR